MKERSKKKEAERKKAERLLNERRMIVFFFDFCISFCCIVSFWILIEVQQSVTNPVAVQKAIIFFAFIFLRRAEPNIEKLHIHTYTPQIYTHSSGVKRKRKMKGKQKENVKKKRKYQRNILFHSFNLILFTIQLLYYSHKQAQVKFPFSKKASKNES